ncbi:MAG: cellulase family glycosylhydrolase [Armatimonadetes bacterium]|nr:cellulase family glycosylhydrolase [Armatimonadota bacterium]
MAATFLTLSAMLAAAIPGATNLQAENGVPKSILNRLTSGVNITRWMCYLANPNDQEHFRNYMKPADWQNFERLGIKYVRLCVSPEAIYDNGKPKAANLPALDAALKALVDHKLAVFLDLHDNGQLKLDSPGQNNTGLITFWEALSQRYKGKYEGDVVFEIVNEPIFNQKNEAVWWELQDKVASAIRKIDPARSILATGTGWGGIDGLVAMQPLKLKNVIYSFHCYDPFFFTHQGASWVGEWPRDMKSVPFPSTPENVEAILSKNDAKFHDALRQYGKERNDAAYLRRRIKLAMDWARKNRVPAILGEFGAYPPVAPVDSRGRWFQAMMAACKAEKAPYCLWGYDDALGLGRKVSPDGGIWLDEVTLKGMYGR